MVKENIVQYRRSESSGVLVLRDFAPSLHLHYDFVTNMETKKQAMVALKREFKQAIKFVLATEGDDPRVTQLVKLRFYAYFKQGTEGKCTGTRPSIFSPLKRLMWESWNRLGKMKKKKAMQLYIKQLDKLETNWRDPNWKRSKL